jgi:hypothetical protein
MPDKMVFDTSSSDAPAFFRFTKTSLFVLNSFLENIDFKIDKVNQE